MPVHLGVRIARISGSHRPIKFELGLAELPRGDPAISCDLSGRGAATVSGAGGDLQSAADWPTEVSGRCFSPQSGRAGGEGETRTFAPIDAALQIG